MIAIAACTIGSQVRSTIESINRIVPELKLVHSLTSTETSPHVTIESVTVYKELNLRIAAISA